jgi:Spy/CpxP family protein refolding chaperone
MRAELNLSEEQKEKIKIVIQKYRPSIKSIAQTIVQNRHALHKAVLAEKRDEITIRKSAENLGKYIGDAALIASQIANDVRPILTAGQIDRIKQFNAKRTLLLTTGWMRW